MNPEYSGFLPENWKLSLKWLFFLDFQTHQNYNQIFNPEYPGIFWSGFLPEKSKIESKMIVFGLQTHQNYSQIDPKVNDFYVMIDWERWAFANLHLLAPSAIITVARLMNRITLLRISSFLRSSLYIHKNSQIYMKYWWI